MSIRNKVKRIVLHGSKALGLFRLSRHLTRKGLRILCYHHFDADDKTIWDSALTIDPDTFRSRIDFLAAEGYSILPLEDAVERLYANKLPPLPTVITIDDGWYNIKRHAHSVLKERSFPYTIYVSSHYSKRQIPLFNIAVKYLFWKTEERTIRIDELDLPFGGGVISDAKSTNEMMNKIVEFGHTHLNYEERYVLTGKIAALLNVDFSSLDQTRVFHFLSAAEIGQLKNDGVDIQLHSYRHRWPLEKEAAIKELSDDREYLGPIVEKKLNHFCYPSGFYSPSQFEYLRDAGIESATTCKSGLNYPHTHRFALNRFLDSEAIHQIEFEAEMSGYLELMRKAKYSVWKLKEVLFKAPSSGAGAELLALEEEVRGHERV